MSFLRAWVLHNWGLKLLALALSFLLWITYQAEPVVEMAYQVPIEFRDIPAELEISGQIATQAHVRIRGRSGLLRRLTAADLGVRVDLTGQPAGETLLPLTPDHVDAPYGVTVVSITPAQIRVPLAPRHTAR